MQTFTESVKEEICSNLKELVNNELLIYFILYSCKSLNKTNFKLKTKYVGLVKFFKYLAATNNKYNIEINVFDSKLKNNVTFYEINFFVNDIKQYSEIIDQFKLSSSNWEFEYNQLFLISAFLMNGSISDPKKSYHLEFRITDPQYKKFLVNVLEWFKLEPKEISYRGKTIIYFKKVTVISDLLKILTANKAMFFLEDNRISRDMVNNLQRLVNLDISNLNKMTKSAVEQSKMCQVIKTSIYYDSLSYKEKIYCDVRAKSPHSNMQTICKIMNEIDHNLLIKKGSLSHIVKKIKYLYSKV